MFRIEFRNYRPTYSKNKNTLEINETSIVNELKNFIFVFSSA